MSACESRQMVAKVSGPQKRANNEPEHRIVSVHPVDASNSEHALEHLHAFGNGEAETAEFTRHETQEQARFVDRFDDRRREMTEALRLGGTLPHDVGDLLDPIEHFCNIGAAHAGQRTSSANFRLGLGQVWK